MLNKIVSPQTRPIWNLMIPYESAQQTPQPLANTNCCGTSGAPNQTRDHETSKSTLNPAEKHHKSQAMNSTIPSNTIFAKRPAHVQREHIHSIDETNTPTLEEYQPLRQAKTPYRIRSCETIKKHSMLKPQKQPKTNSNATTIHVRTLWKTRSAHRQGHGTWTIPNEPQERTQSNWQTSFKNTRVRRLTAEQYRISPSAPHSQPDDIQRINEATTPTTEQDQPMRHVRARATGNIATMKSSKSLDAGNKKGYPGKIRRAVGSRACGNISLP